MVGKALTGAHCVGGNKVRSESGAHSSPEGYVVILVSKMFWGIGIIILRLGVRISTRSMKNLIFRLH